MCKTPHKHAELIKAWADGAQIQVSLPGRTKWIDCRPSFPGWDVNLEYRIKPEPKPDIIRYAKAVGYEYRLYTEVDNTTYWTRLKCGGDNIKATFDGETTKLKKVEMLDE